MFRRAGEKVRIAVLWSAGTLTGWEHVFWPECDFEAFAGQVREEVRGIRAAAASAFKDTYEAGFGSMFCALSSTTGGVAGTRSSWRRWCLRIAASMSQRAPS
jgi:hypothetical protein